MINHTHHHHHHQVVDHLCRVEHSRFNLFTQSVGARLLLAVVALVALWAAVAWAW